MFLFNVFHDINHDVAQIIQYAARIYDDMVSKISSLQIVDYDLFECTPRDIDMRRTTSTEANRLDEQKDIESQWCVLQNVDWTYDDSWRVDNSSSI